MQQAGQGACQGGGAEGGGNPTLGQMAAMQQQQRQQQQQQGQPGPQAKWGGGNAMPGAGMGGGNAQAARPQQSGILQQQVQANAMLSQLPEQQKGQIEQAVNTYRNSLVLQGFPADVVQTYVWSYYTQCVTSLYQDFQKAKGGEEGAAAAAAGQQQQQGEPSEQEKAQSLRMGMQAQQMKANAMGGGDGAAGLTSPAASAMGNATGAMAVGAQQVGPRGMRPMMAGGFGNFGGGGGWKQQMDGSDGQEGMGGFAGMAGDQQAGMPGAGRQCPLAQQVAMSAAQNAAFSGMGMGMAKMGGMMSAPWQQRQGGGMGQGMVNGAGTALGGGGGATASSGLHFPITVCPPGGCGMGDGTGRGLQHGFRPNTPAARLAMQQAQHEQRMLQQGGVAGRPGGPQWGAQGQMPGMGGFGARGPMAPGFRGPQGACGTGAAALAAGGKGLAGQRPRMMGAGGAMPAARPAGGQQQFPESLQRWLQRLYQHYQSKGDKSIPKQTHVYLKNLVQQWIKTGELWTRNWDTHPLPSMDEVLKNLPPGSLGGVGGALQGASASSGPVRPKAPGSAPDGEDGEKRGLAQRLGFSGGSSRRSPNRSSHRSRSRSRRRSRSARRRKHKSPSSSRSRSRSKRGSRLCKASKSRSRSRSQDGSQRDGSPQKQKANWWEKNKGKGKGGRGMGADEQREKVRSLLHDRLEASDCKGRHKELQEELQWSLGVSAKRFRHLFQQTVAQYVAAYYASSQGAGNPEAVTPGEQEMRAQRAARFQSHLEVERKPVSMVSFTEEGAGGLDGGPIIGELTEMCSRAEAKEREMTRQLDKFEWKQGTDPKHPEVNLALATKKYQRSSADKAYRSQDVRNLEACWRTMEYLMTEVLDFDRNPKPGFAVQAVPYIEVYSYLRDRTRACRVDLHLQQPRSTPHRTFAETHECCLRFEMLSLFLLSGGSGGSTEKYDEKLGLKAISQTIEPLLNSYQAVRDKQLARSILAQAMGDFAFGEPEEQEEYVSPFEMAAHRYIILLLMSFSPEELQTHLAKLSRETLSHPLVNFAAQVHAALKTDDYGKFLRCYRNADFLTAVAMSGVVDLARMRALWLLLRAYPQPVGDKMPLARISNFLAFASEQHARSFLAFHGVKVLEAPKGSAEGAMVLLPKKGTPEAAACTLLAGPARLPEKCEFPKGADSMLMAKFQELGMSRADIVFGAADPVIAEPEPAAPMEVAAEPEAEQAAEAAAAPADSGEAPAAAPAAAAAEEEAPKEDIDVDKGKAEAGGSDEAVGPAETPAEAKPMEVDTAPADAKEEAKEEPAVAAATEEPPAAAASDSAAAKEEAPPPDKEEPAPTADAGKEEPAPPAEEAAAEAAPSAAEGAEKAPAAPAAEEEDKMEVDEAAPAAANAGREEAEPAASDAGKEEAAAEAETGREEPAPAEAGEESKEEPPREEEEKKKGEGGGGGEAEGT